MSASGERELFVYYRVDAERWHEIVEAVRAMQAGLVRDTAALQARVLAAPDRTMLMEIYRRPGFGIDAAMADEIERRATGFAGRVDGARHCEIFIGC